MITEDYVSFETAKLLKEKGFNEEDSPFYSEQDRDEWVQNNNYSIPNPDYNKDIPFDSETITMVAPHVSLQMAMKWLREVHDLHIIVSPYKVGKEEKAFHWCCEVYKSFNLLGCRIYVNETPKSYEEGVEIAIRYCLENLIQIAKKF